MKKKTILFNPVVSEKSYSLMDSGSYVFSVEPTSTKIEIRQAVESTFQVRVKKVNTLRRSGKVVTDRRSGRQGKKPDIKRAIVTLQPGDKIEIFEEVRS